jgi:hypothetical protein
MALADAMTSPSEGEDAGRLPQAQDARAARLKEACCESRSRSQMIKRPTVLVGIIKEWL